jgi:hypothetical protein
LEEEERGRVAAWCELDENAVVEGGGREGEVGRMVLHALDSEEREQSFWGQNKHCRARQTE